MPGKCPNCGSERIHRSRRRGAAERLIALAGFRFRRCHECRFRYAAVGRSVLLTSDIHRVLRRLGVIVILAGALAAVLGFVLWFNAADAPYTPVETGAVSLGRGGLLQQAFEVAAELGPVDRVGQREFHEGLEIAPEVADVVPFLLRPQPDGHHAAAFVA